MKQIKIKTDELIKMLNLCGYDDADSLEDWDDADLFEAVSDYLVEYKDMSYNDFTDDDYATIKGEYIYINMNARKLSTRRQRIHYYKKKRETQEKAQTLQVYQGAISWAELAEQGEQLRKDAEKYGLLKEFKREGIL